MQQNPIGWTILITNTYKIIFCIWPFCLSVSEFACEKLENNTYRFLGIKNFSNLPSQSRRVEGGPDLHNIESLDEGLEEVTTGEGGIITALDVRAQFIEVLKAIF